MISKYLRIRERNDEVVIFHELHPNPVYCSREKWQQFIQNQSHDLILEDSLKRRKLIVESHIEDQVEYNVASVKLQRKHSQAGTLYLMTAQGCNFDCKYCFVPELARKYGDSRLSVDDAIAGIDLWYEHVKDTHDPDQQYLVIFYGGEPLLNIETIRQSLAYLRNMKSSTGFPCQLNFLIVTNGVLVDDAVVRMCKEYEIMVAVSLDGNEAIHDAMRLDRDGNGTYQAVVSAIRKLTQAGIRTFGSVTIASHNAGRLQEVSAHLQGLNVEKFGFNFVKGKRLFELVGEEGVEKYCRETAEAVVQYSRGHVNGFDYQLEKKVQAFNEQDFFPHDCTCYGSQLVIQPDGKISNCPFFKSNLGHVRNAGKDFRIWDQPLVKEWRKRLPLYHAGLRKNDAKAMCGAGCAWSSQELYGDFLAVDQSSRIFGEEVFNELIWSKR